MTDDTTTLADAVVPVIGAAIAFLDTDAAFGPQHERTVKAKAQLRSAVAQLFGLDDDLPPLHVIRGGRAEK